MRIDILTLFPQYFKSPLETSLHKRALDAGLLRINVVDIRDFASDKHKTADDVPYGGGPGMVMKCEPLFACIESVYKGENGVRIFLTPDGEKLDNKLAKKLSQYEQLIILCGHYEGVDERVRENLIDIEISIGDYVLTGGELAALVLIDAVSRFVPGVVGDMDSVCADSFEDGLLDFPHYTRPAEFRGLAVPETLVSGHHANIAKWRRKKQLERSLERRPDLLEKAALSSEDLKTLEKIKAEKDK